MEGSGCGLGGGGWGGGDVYVGWGVGGDRGLFVLFGFVK